MIHKSMLSGFDPTGGSRFSEKIMLHQKSSAMPIQLKAIAPKVTN